jgi:hypothetical protein
MYNVGMDILTDDIDAAGQERALERAQQAIDRADLTLEAEELSSPEHIEGVVTVLSLERGDQRANYRLRIVGGGALIAYR